VLRTTGAAVILIGKHQSKRAVQSGAGLKRRSTKKQGGVPVSLMSWSKRRLAERL
jgi:hypothetical protein